MTLLALALAWLSGTYLVVLLDQPPGLAIPVLLLGFGSLPAVWALWPTPHLRLAALVVAALLLGAARGLQAEAALEHDPLASAAGEQELLGIVATAPQRLGERVSAVLEIEARLTGETWTPQNGRLWLQVYGGPSLHYGDAVRVTGRVAEPRASAGYPLPALLRRQGIRYVVERPRVTVLERNRGDPVWSAIHAARESIAASVRQYLQEPHASLVAGLLVGTRTQMPAELREALVASGTSHVVAVSGFNVAVLAGIVIGLISRTAGRRFLLLPALAAIALYTALSGPQPSAVRAALMSGAGLVAMSVGRIADPLTSLLAAGALMLALEPLQALDLGFQLSLLATAGLVLFHQPLAARLSWMPRWLAEPLAATLAAQLATLPLIAATFHTLSVVSPLANLLIAPVLPLLMGLGALVALAAPLPPLASLLAWPAWAVAGFVLAVVGTAGSAPGALMPLGGLPLATVVAVTISVLGLGVLALPEARGLLRRLPATGRHAGLFAIGVGLVILSLVPAVPLLLPTDGRLQAWTLDLGGSAALLARTGSGRTLVITTDAPPARLADALARHLRPWEGRLGALAVADQNSLAGLSRLLARHPTDVVVVAAQHDRGAEGIGTQVILQPGQRLELDRDVWLSHLVGGDEDAESAPGWLLEFGLVFVKVMQASQAGTSGHEANGGVEAVLRTSSPRPDDRPNGAAPATAQLLIAPRPLPSAQPAHRSRPVTLSLEAHGEVRLETDGVDLLARPSRCALPPTGEGCDILLTARE